MKENQEQYKNIEKSGSIEIAPHTILQPETQRSPEKFAELSVKDIENRTEKARKDVAEIVNGVEEKGKESEKAQSQTSSPSRRGPISKKQKNESYKRTLKQVQKELPIGSRAFSKITHNRFIEKASDIAGNTIARPNAMLSGAVVAFIITLLAYTIAKKSGYALSGFETVGAFLFGWAIGITYDYLRALITGKK